MTQWYRICFHHVTRFFARRLEPMVERKKPATKAVPAAPSTYPGQRLKLPETGPQSVARVGRRIAAIFIDWVIAIVVTMLATGASYALVSSTALGQVTTLGIFVVMQMLGIWAIGGSLGHRAVGLHVVGISGGKLEFWRPVVRSILVGLVIPALVWDSDQRGFHDKIAGTILLRSR